MSETQAAPAEGDDAMAAEWAAALAESRGMRVEAVATHLERAAQLDVVEDLAVVRDPDGLVLVMHGLGTTREVDDRQARVTQTKAGLQVKPGAVRSTMVDGGHHAFEHVGVR